MLSGKRVYITRWGLHGGCRVLLQRLRRWCMSGGPKLLERGRNLRFRHRMLLTRMAIAAPERATHRESVAPTTPVRLTPRCVRQMAIAARITATQPPNFAAHRPPVWQPLVPAPRTQNAAPGVAPAERAEPPASLMALHVRATPIVVVATAILRHSSAETTRTPVRMRLRAVPCRRIVVMA